MRPWPALVGRPAELAVLDALLLSVAQGRGTAVAVVGEAGIGKSRLLAELGDRAALTADPDSHYARLLAASSATPDRLAG